MYGEGGIRDTADGGLTRQGCSYSGYTVFAGEFVPEGGTNDFRDYYDCGYKVRLDCLNYAALSRQASTAIPAQMALLRQWGEAQRKSGARSTADMPMGSSFLPYAGPDSGVHRPGQILCDIRCRRWARAVVFLLEQAAGHQTRG